MATAHVRSPVSAQKHTCVRARARVCACDVCVSVSPPMANDNRCAPADLQDVKRLILWHSGKQCIATTTQSSSISNIRALGVYPTTRVRSLLCLVCACVCVSHTSLIRCQRSMYTRGRYSVSRVLICLP